MHTPLILASSSPRRRAMIAALGQPFTTASPDIDETRRHDETPLAYVLRLSREKAAAVLAHVTGAALVLAADTIVLAGDADGSGASGDLLGKPATPTEAQAMLRRLRDHPHHVYTAFTLHRAGDAAPLRSEAVRTSVTMRPYTDAEIAAYVASGDPFDKAGGYAIQHPAFHPVAHIDGCYNNVVGLPLCRVKHALAAAGWPITAPEACDCPDMAAPCA